MIGLPVMSRDTQGSLSIQPDSSSSRDTRIRIGTSPLSSGIPLSCMGTAAKSEISSVTTNSTGCSSPSCRFPMMRMAVIINM